MGRWLARWALRVMPALLLGGLILIVIPTGIFNSYGMPSGQNVLRSTYSPSVIIGIILLLVSGTVLLTPPSLVYFIYRAKIYDSQPWFFGIEGHVYLYDLELLIFGSNEGRLQQSVAGSPLSRHEIDRSDFPTDPGKKSGQRSSEETSRLAEERDMCRGLDPVKAGAVDPQASLTSKKKLFTLVDTCTMTVALFGAARPPVAVILCGAEGGMQRALLCSYDWTGGTFYRETVLRMETRAWDRMDTMCRVRLGLDRRDAGTPIENPTRFRRRKGPWLKRLAHAVGARV